MDDADAVRVVGAESGLVRPGSGSPLGFRSPGCVAPYAKLGEAFPLGDGEGQGGEGGGETLRVPSAMYLAGLR